MGSDNHSERRSPVYWSLLRRLSAILMALPLLFLLSCPCAAEDTSFLVVDDATVSIALPLDYKEGGRPPRKDGWVMDGKAPVSYRDSTLEATFSTDSITHKLVSGNHRGRTVTDEIWVVRIKIKHATQLRTAVSYDSYKNAGKANPVKIAAGKNAVIAMNGDYFKCENTDAGYVVRQGELIRDATHNARGLVFDTLLIDSEGDFHAVEAAVTETIDAYVRENLTPLGRTVMDSFNIGPVLVRNGEVQDVAHSEVTKHGGREGMYQWSTPIQRICIAQTGPLEYAIVAANAEGARKSGFTMAEFAQIVAERVPDAILAYNLDGGGSAQIVANGARVFHNKTMRHIPDIIYFASAEE